ncbi:hypothetical protein KKB40_02720 [Patescibacteria group bacterium]|nr:hypothetical protein [Patescibacteria group bacterium]
MTYRYSRRAKIEEKKNIRKAVFFGLLTLVSAIAFFFLGLPAVIKFASFLTELKTSTTLVEFSDNTPPPPPQLESLPSFTNELSVEIKGSTEPGITVILFLNNKQEELLTNSEGKFSYKFNLNDGKNSISAMAKDSFGNESRKIEIQEIVFDNKPPELTITKPENGSSFYTAKERQVVIEGTTEEGCSVNINGRQVVVESDGSFAFATTLSEGENDFNVKSQDEAGNTSEQSLSVSFTL